MALGFEKMEPGSLGLKVVLYVELKVCSKHLYIRSISIVSIVLGTNGLNSAGVPLSNKQTNKFDFQVTLCLTF